jgi:hypothetical protein
MFLEEKKCIRFLGKILTTTPHDKYGAKRNLFLVEIIEEKMKKAGC